MATLKRFEPPRMFELLAKFGARWPKIQTDRYVGADFLVVPRYNACIRGCAASIDFFFSRIHRVKTIRTRVFRLVLKAACTSRVLRLALQRAGIISEVINSESYEGIDWSKIDVLFAEWHFVGAFSGETGEVAHVLGFPDFKEKLEREITARGAVGGTVDLPAVKHAFSDDPSGWVEEIVGGVDGQLISDDDYYRAQQQLLEIYEATSKEVDAGGYLNRLMTTARCHYDSDQHAVLSMLIELEQLAKYLISKHDVSTLTLARSHGDFKPSQILRDDTRLYIIDWTESDVTWILHDLVSLLMIPHGKFRTSGDTVPDELRPLLTGLQPELARVPRHLPFVITLIEIAVRQHVPFKKGRGPISAWKHCADTIVRMGKARRTPSSVESKI